MTTRPDIKRWGVQFNENAMTFSCHRAVAEWWWPWRKRMNEVPGKIIILNGYAPGGDLIIICASDHEEAEFVHSHMISRGVPASMLKVRTIPEMAA